MPGRSTKVKGREEGEEESGMKLFMKWLRASRRRQALLRRPRRLHQEQRGKVSCEDGTARKLKMRKRKKKNSGKMET